MLQIERENLAEEATGLLSKKANTSNWEMIADVIKHKIILAMACIDRVSRASSMPLIIADVVPGYDLAVTRPADKGPAIIEQDLPSDVRGLVPIEAEIMNLLSQVFDDFSKTNPTDVFAYDSFDGTNYFAFKSVHRDKAATALGVAEINIVDLSQDALVLQ